MNYCNKCSCCVDCGKPKDKCRCPDQILGIENLDSNLAYLTFNDGGRSVKYNFEPMIKATETDTSVSVDALGRVLKYLAERHIDTISAKELGSILHIADIGDVDISDLKNDSLFVYKKDSDCGEGCENVSNGWSAWNALDHLTDSTQYLMGFNSEGGPVSLNAPIHPNKHYLLGWAAGNKVSYFSPAEVSAPPIDEDGYAYQLWVDPSTGEIVYTKVTP